jgi:hypothetical protein
MKSTKTTPLEQIGWLHTEYDDQGRSLMVIDDDKWQEATSMDYIEGIPMLMKRK